MAKNSSQIGSIIKGIGLLTYDLVMLKVQIHIRSPKLSSEEYVQQLNG